MKNPHIQPLPPHLILFREISKNVPLHDILIFGCGDSSLPRLSYHKLNPQLLIAYDINKVKIDNKNGRIKTNPDYQSLNIKFTHEKPKEKYDLVLSVAVFHENPEQISREMIELTKKGGLIGLIDYDMKNMERTDFFNRWGHYTKEKDELNQIGENESYKIHTTSGLKDCEKIMKQKGITKKFSKGNLDTTWFNGPKPTKHFLYLGKKA
jgi:hypothetical protein